MTHYTCLPLGISPSVSYWIDTHLIQLCKCTTQSRGTTGCADDESKTSHHTEYATDKSIITQVLQYFSTWYFFDDATIELNTFTKYVASSSSFCCNLNTAEPCAVAEKNKNGTVWLLSETAALCVRNRRLLLSATCHTNIKYKISFTSTSRGSIIIARL